MNKKIGIALGSGGAKGLVHLHMLNVIEELGIPIHQISGASIGAIFGAAFAAGVPTSRIRSYIESISYDSSAPLGEMLNTEVLKWFSFIGVQFTGKALFNVEKFLDEIMPEIGYERIEDLPIPLKIVAANFWDRSEYVFEKGDLRTAIKASMALPVLFNPVVLDDKTVLVDGGATNPVPYDLLDDCDIRIAINVMGKRAGGEELLPNMLESLFNTFQIMQNSILLEKLKSSRPDILMEPNVKDIQMLDFLKAIQILKQSESCKDLFRTKLNNCLESH